MRKRKRSHDKDKRSDKSQVSSNLSVLPAEKGNRDLAKEIKKRKDKHEEPKKSDQDK